MKPTVDAKFWRGVRYALLPSLALWLLILVLVGCASHPVPEVSADEAAGEHPKAQALLAIFELIPGAGFFFLPVEYALTGTTGLTEFWRATCDGAGGSFDESNGDCTFDDMEE